jgi:hypothetical protein
MALARETPQPQKKPREPHKCIPVRGEFGRYTVASASAAKEGKEEVYIVDVLQEEETNVGVIVGTCPCKGWSIRKTCSHLEDAKKEHARLEAEKLGFDKLD